MDDLISRQAAIDALGMAIDVDDFRTATGLIHEATVNKVLDCIPAADVVPVVRCEDCKYHSFDAEYGNYWCNLTSGSRKIERFDFCSYGRGVKHG